MFERKGEREREKELARQRFYIHCLTPQMSAKGWSRLIREAGPEPKFLM